jgi:hypothetical protein
VPGRHITEALGGQPGEPLSPAERVERERVRTLIQAVASCCNTLATREPTAPPRPIGLPATAADTARGSAAGRPDGSRER